MQQLHRRKVHELQDLMAHPESLERATREAEEQVERGQQDQASVFRASELRRQLDVVLAGDALTNYLLEFIPFANEEADIQCELAMKRKAAGDDRDQLFELSQQTRARLLDLTRRYKEAFWPQLVGKDDEQTGGGAYAPLQTRDVEDMLDEDGVPYNEVRRCTYRRINHFREYLRQQQGKSRVQISPAVLAILRAELKKHHYEPSQCTPQIVRYLLKNLNQTATKVCDMTRLGGAAKNGVSRRLRPQQFSWALIYEHTPTITLLLNPSYRLINIPTERERLLCHLFEKTEAPFEKYKIVVKKGRKNFLSYPFVTYKLCELLGWDEYLPAFALLKSDDLLILQDSYFKLICKELGWQFVPTVGRVDFRETFS